MLPRLGCASEYPDIRSTNVQSLNQTKREVATSWLPMNLLKTSPSKLLASRAAGLSPCSWLRLGPGAGSVQRREDNRPVGQGRSPNTGLAPVARVASFHFHLEGKIKAYVGHVTQDMKRKLGGITGTGQTRPTNYTSTLLLNRATFSKASFVSWPTFRRNLLLLFYCHCIWHWALWDRVWELNLSYTCHRLQ